MAQRFRDVYRFLVPAWLRTDDGDKVLYAQSIMADAYSTWARAVLEARMPSRAGDSALALLGADRAILRGRTETSAHYATRLIGWRSPRGHKVRGSAWAVLQQVSEYFGGLAEYSIDMKGNRYDWSAAGVSTYAAGAAWNWDGTTAPVYRFWLVLKPVGTFTYSISDVQAIRGLFGDPAPWKPAGTRAEWAIVSTDGTEPAPNGTWLNWSRNVAGVQTPTRPTNMLFWSLCPTLNNLYAGAQLLPTSYPTILAGNYTPSSAAYPATITLSDGATTYAGTPAFAPYQLLDDGDLIT